MVWAHRGSRTLAPENTLESFSLAISQKADGIELDVHLTADGEIVVTHDESVDRVSNGKGLVVSKTLSELKELDFSKGFPSFSPARIPTLREVYDLIHPTNLTVNVEIKSGMILYEGIEQKLIKLAREMNMQDRLIYSSFNHYSLLLAREADPSVKIGLLYSEAIIDPFIYAQHVKADAIHPFYPTLAAPGIIEGCKKYGVKVHPWTVNDPKAMRRLIDAGVDALITDTPDVALKILEEENKL
jgi:glycerophosphoryl diester phosphodiesterase